MRLFVRDKNFYKKTAAIAIPISLQSLITIGVNMTDNIMIGSLGENALSGTALANQFITIFHIGCMGISMGASVLTSRFWGMKDKESLKKTITIMLRFCILLSALFMAVTIISPSFLMRIYTSDIEVIKQGVLYYKWMVPCYILLGLSLTCTIILRSVGQVKIPLLASIGAFFINVFFNYMFIFGNFGAPAMGTEGAALGTFLGRIFEFSVICIYFFFYDKKIGYRLKDIFMNCKSIVRDYITVSIPVFISDILLALGNSAVAMVMGRIGKDFVSANSITVVTQQLTTVFIQGVCHSGSIITGHTLGEGKKKKAQEQAYTFLMLGIIIGAMSGAIILALSNTVVNFYNITDETKTIAIELMRSIAIIVVFQSMNSILTKGVLRGGGDTKFLMLADILFLWILSIPLGYLAGLVWNWSAYWIYFCLKSDQIVKAIWCIFRLRSGKWIKAINKQEL
ncbi:MAG: MATE family efflux transporter [Clostridiales bacterium]|nr:MATE family efflux transporter [Clostridiales bacterium]